MELRQIKNSESEQLLADAKKDISELKEQLRDALNASHESEKLLADAQTNVSELQTQLKDALCVRDEYEELRVNDQTDISELKIQLTAALTTIEELKADIKIKVCTTNACMDVYKCTNMKGTRVHANYPCAHVHVNIYYMYLMHVCTYTHTNAHMNAYIDERMLYTNIYSKAYTSHNTITSAANVRTHTYRRRRNSRRVK